MGMLSMWHWLVIAGVALLLFGNRLPDVARSMGRAINEFKRGLKDVESDADNTTGSGPDPERLKAGAKRADEDEAEKKAHPRVKETQPEEQESVK
ncbi:MAG: hypothetical protein AMXMBFR47_00380 [Planctomycetota bacterium]